MSQSLVRFIIGGAIVAAFAIIGDVLKPKSFAGLFGAAPKSGLPDTTGMLGQSCSEMQAIQQKLVNVLHEVAHPKAE
jgi:hypothetical protein